MVRNNRQRFSKGAPSNTFVILRCNVIQELIQDIVRIKLKFLKCRVWPERHHKGAARFSKGALRIHFLDNAVI